LAEQGRPQNHRADGADPCPDGVGGAQGERAQRRTQQARLTIIDTTVATDGQNRVKPSVYLSPTAQPISTVETAVDRFP